MTELSAWLEGMFLVACVRSHRRQPGHREGDACAGCQFLMWEEYDWVNEVRDLGWRWRPPRW